MHCTTAARVCVFVWLFNNTAGFGNPPPGLNLPDVQAVTCRVRKGNLLTLPSHGARQRSRGWPCHRGVHGMCADVCGSLCNSTVITASNHHTFVIVRNGISWSNRGGVCVVSEGSTYIPPCGQPPRATPSVPPAPFDFNNDKDDANCGRDTGNETKRSEPCGNWGPRCGVRGGHRALPSQGLDHNDDEPSLHGRHLVLGPLKYGTVPVAVKRNGRGAHTKKHPVARPVAGRGRRRCRARHTKRRFVACTFHTTRTCCGIQFIGAAKTDPSRGRDACRRSSAQAGSCRTHPSPPTPGFSPATCSHVPG